MVNSLLYRQIRLNSILGHVLLLFVVLLSSSLTLAQEYNPTFFNPNQKLSNFILRNWSTEDGLPSSTILEVVQGKDGYIWMSSYDGLIRFDGHSFETFNKRNGKKLKSNRFSKLYANTANDDIWIGTNQDGLLKVEHDTLTSISRELEDLQIQSFCFDSINNRTWLGTSRAGLYFLEDGHIRRIRYEEVMDVNINDIHLDEQGTVWIATEGKGLSQYKNGKWTTLDMPHRYLYRISPGKHGKLWICHAKGLFSLQGTTVEEYHVFDGFWTYRVFENQQGDLLIANRNGLCRITGGDTYEWLNESHGMPDTEVTDMIFDHEGSLWLSTYRGGLIQLAEGKFENITQEDGLTSKVASIVYEMEPNIFWLGGTNSTINIIQNGHVNKQSVKLSSPNGRIYSIIKDSRKRIWIATYEGLIMIDENGKEFRYTEQDVLPSNLVRVIYEDSHDNIWVGTKTNGLVRITPDMDFQLVNVETRGLSDNFIMDIAEDKEKRVLVATNNGGLNIIHPDLSIEQYTVAEGLSNNLIFNIYVDQLGIIWLSTKAGISRFNGKTFANIQEPQGMPVESIYDIVEDDYGFLWMTSSQGIIKVSKESINQYVAGNGLSIHWQIYDRQDGMRQSECTAATSSLKASDGTLWFPTIDGVAIIHPKNDKINKVPPFVKITSFAADNSDQNRYGSLLFPYETKRYVFNFAGLSLLAPDKVHYRYALEDFDEELLFTDERKAIYTNLPYGDFVFKVWASNNDGIWSEAPASISFSIQRPYWAKWWFILGCLIFIISIGVLSHKLRVHNIKEQKRLLEGKVVERTKDLQAAKEVLEENNSKIREQNKELEQQQEEILAQRDEIEAQNRNLILQKSQIEDKNFEIQRNHEVIERQNEQLKNMNLELESKVQKRTIELQHAYQDLLKAHKQVDHFTYRSAHDLKGPIARLLGLCYLAKMEVTDELGLKYMGMLEGTAQQMGNLLNKLLRTHEIRTVKVRPEILNLNRIIQSVWDRLYGFSGTIDFQFNPKEEIQHITDPYLIEVLIENIIQNAIQYRDREKDNGYLNIQILQDSESTSIIFKDNGMGIPLELGNQAFEMFMKGTERSEGAGLGLYEAKVIVEERLGGKIWLRQFGEGIETEIEVILPFVNE